MMKWNVVLGVSFLVMGLNPSDVGPTYPSNNNNNNNNNNGQSFLPETEGGKPDCVQDPRDTFCTDPKKYPKDRILYLLENKMFNVDSMLMDESRDSYIFESRQVKAPVTMYTYDHVRQKFEPPRQKYEPPIQSYKPQSQSYGPPPPPPPPQQHPSPPSISSSGYLPPRYNNYSYSTTSKPYYPPPLPPPTKYGPPPPHSHHTTYSGPPYHYGATSSSSSSSSASSSSSYDSDGPYPRYMKTATTPSSYLTRYLPPPPPRAPPKQQPWWRKFMRSSRRRQKRQLSSSELCPYEEDYLMPRAALSNRGQWMFLVNLEEVSDQYTQAVQIKKCIPDTSCSGSCNVPAGFTPTCQQQYVQKRLIALDGSGRSLSQDLFWFPACCLCTIVQDG